MKWNNFCKTKESNRTEKRNNGTG